MTQLYLESGMYGNLLLLMLIASIIFVILTARKVFAGKNVGITIIKEDIETIFRVGILCAGTGFLGTIHGLYQAMDVISKSAAISPQIVFQGIKVALGTTVIGFIIFVILSITGFILQFITKMKLK